MVASLLYHKERTARWFIAQRALDIMCVALAPTRGQTPANLVANPVGPRLREVAATRSNSRVSAVGLVLEGRYGYLLIHWSG